MSISALNNSQQVAYSQFFTSQSVNNQSNTPGTTTQAANNGNGGNFFQAINGALSQLGISTSTTAGNSSTSGTASTGSSETPQQALQSFIQNLFAAIQSQVGGQSSGSGSATQALSGGGHHHHHGGGAGKLENGIQNLINQLNATSGSGTTSTTSSAASTGANSVGGTGSSNGTNNTVAALQSSFNTLLSTDGISSNSASLTSFLQSLEQNLQGSTTSGNVIQAQA